MHPSLLPYIRLYYFLWAIAVFLSSNSQIMQHKTWWTLHLILIKNHPLRHDRGNEGTQSPTTLFALFNVRPTWKRHLKHSSKQYWITCSNVYRFVIIIYISPKISTYYFTDKKTTQVIQFGLRILVIITAVTVFKLVSESSNSIIL